MLRKKEKHNRDLPTALRDLDLSEDYSRLIDGPDSSYSMAFIAGPSNLCYPIRTNWSPEDALTDVQVVDPALPCEVAPALDNGTSLQMSPEHYGYQDPHQISSFDYRPVPMDTCDSAPQMGDDGDGCSTAVCRGSKPDSCQSTRDEMQMLQQDPAGPNTAPDRQRDRDRSDTKNKKNYHRGQERRRRPSCDLRGVAADVTDPQRSAHPHLARIMAVFPATFPTATSPQHLSFYPPTLSDSDFLDQQEARPYQEAGGDVDVTVEGEDWVYV